MIRFIPGTLRLFGRALRLRCPNCGEGKMFSSWLRMRARCPVCGLKLERGEEGYQVGSYMFNIVAATWPTPPWKLLEYGGIVMMVIAPLVFFPFSKTLFLAFDLVFRPATRDELLPAASNSRNAH
jgi:uncharacterized protein (DUF983 family)